MDSSIKTSSSLFRALQNRNLFCAIGRYLNVGELGIALTVSKLFKERFSDEILWRHVSILYQLGPAPKVKFYDLVRNHVWRWETKLKIGGVLDKHTCDLHFRAGKDDDLEKRAREVPFRIALPEIPYSQIIALIQHNLSNLSARTLDFSEAGLFDIVFLFSERMGSGTRGLVIADACKAKRFDLVPQLKPDLLDAEDRRYLFIKEYCREIRGLLLTSGPFLPFQEEWEAPDFITKIYHFNCLDLIREIAATLGGYRGGLIMSILKMKSITQESELEGVYALLESGDVGIADRERIMQEACDRGFDLLLRKCIGRGWGISETNRGLFIAGGAKSGSMRILDTLREGISTLDQGQRGIAIGYAVRRGHSEIVHRLRPERLSSNDRAQCVIGALKGGHLKLAHTLMLSGPIDSKFHDQVIIEAASAGSIEIVRLFSDFSPQVRYAAILGASINNHIEVIEFLGPEKLTENDRGEILRKIVMEGEKEAFRVIFKSGPIDKRSQELALYHALDFNILEFFQSLIGLGLPEDPLVVDKCIASAAKHGEIRILEIFSKGGREISAGAIDKAIRNAIEKLSEETILGIFQFLSPKRMTPRGRAFAVMDATRSKQRKLIQVLLESGEIPLEPLDRYGQSSSRDAACEIALQQRDVEMLKLLQPELLTPTSRGGLLDTVKDPACMRLILRAGPIPRKDWENSVKHSRMLGETEMLKELEEDLPPELRREFFNEEICELAQRGEIQKLEKHHKSSFMPPELRMKAIAMAVRERDYGFLSRYEEVLKLLRIESLDSDFRKSIIKFLLENSSFFLPYLGGNDPYTIAFFILNSAPLEAGHIEEIEKVISELPIASHLESKKKILLEMREVIKKLKNK